MWARITESLRGNPILVRHLATTFTGPRLGFAFLLVTGALLGLYATLFAAATFGDLEPGLTYFGHNTVMLGLLMVLLPLKVSGIIEGPRINRAFDQIVATGVQPASFYWGAWLSGMAYAALILFVTIPFAACMTMFGDVDLALMARGYATLLVYSNVIIATTLALSVFGREWLTTPISIVVLGGVSVLAFVPDRWFVREYPPLLAELSPIRLLLHQAQSDPNFHPALRATDPVLLLWEVPTDLARIVLWGVVVAVSALLFSIGPGHVFSPGLDNFGAVVLRGDRKRGLLGRLRGGLTRRIEMAFFYENAPRWTRRWGGAIRYVLATWPVLLAIALIIGIVFGASPAPARALIHDDWRMMTCIWMGGGAVSIWSLGSCTHRSNVLTAIPVGRFSFSREVVLIVLFVLMLGFLFVCEYLPMARIAADHVAGRFVSVGRVPFTTAELDAYVRDWWQLIGAMLILTVNVFLIVRLASRWIDRPIQVRGAALLGIGLLLGVPALIAVLIREEELSWRLLPIAALSPGVLHPRFEAPGWESGAAWSRYMTGHVVLSGIMALLLSLRYFGVGRVGRRKAAAAAAFLICACGLTAVSPSQEPVQDADPSRERAFQIESVVRGFNGLVFAFDVDFYTAVVKNRGNGTISATCWIDEEDRKWGHTEFVLSPGASRILRFSAPNRKRLQRWRGSNPSRVVFQIGSRIIPSEPLDLAVVTPSQAANRGGNNQQVRSEHYLFVGNRGSFPQVWMDMAVAGGTASLAASPPAHLPESARGFDGLEIVWMTAQSLGELNRSQQDALYHYLLLGGTVVFSGAVHDADLPGSGAWSALLRPKEQSSFVFEGKDLRRVRLNEGRDVLAAIPVGGTAAEPVLNLRHVGAGSLAHLAFAPVVSAMPESLRSSQEFWKSFDAALPRGRFPLSSRGVIDMRVVGDKTALFLLGGYYLLYVVVLSAGLFFFARRRRHRRRVWLLVAVLPVVFLAVVPLMIAAANQRPSLAEFSEVAFYHAGSTEGVVVRHLRIHSAGKQRHAMTMRGQQGGPPLVFAGSPSQWRYRYAYAGSGGFSELTPLPLRRDAEGRWEFEMDFASWTTAELLAFDSEHVDHLVTGEARLRNNVLELQAVLPPSLRGRPTYAIVMTNGTSRSIPVTADEQGRVRVEARSKQPQPRQRFGTGSPAILQVHRRFYVDTRIGAGTAVFLAVEPEALGEPAVGSADLGFEREVAKYEAERARLAIGTRQGSSAYRPVRHIRRDGDRYMESLDHRLLLFEIPLVPAK